MKTLSESDEYKASIKFVQELLDKGVMHEEIAEKYDYDIRWLYKKFGEETINRNKRFKKGGDNLCAECGKDKGANYKVCDACLKKRRDVSTIFGGHII